MKIQFQYMSTSLWFHNENSKDSASSINISEYVNQHEMSKEKKNSAGQLSVHMHTQPAASLLDTKMIREYMRKHHTTSNQGLKLFTLIADELRVNESSQPCVHLQCTNGLTHTITTSDHGLDHSKLMEWWVHLKICNIFHREAETQSESEAAAN